VIRWSLLAGKTERPVVGIALGDIVFPRIHGERQPWIR
jgi:hypothetical protein